MSREQRIREINDMCDQHGCSDKVCKIHFDQYVDRHWHPHPPAEFVQWWMQQHEYIQSEVLPKPAWNTEYYRAKFLEYNSGRL